MKNYYESFYVDEVDYCLSGVRDYFNKRIRIDWYIGNLGKIIDYTAEIAKKHQFEKIIIKARNEHTSFFVEQGFLQEATIPGYFQGSSMHFVTKYLANNRRNSPFWVQEDELLIAAKNKLETEAILTKEYTIKKATIHDTERLSQLFQEVFQIYPTPLNEPKYVEKSMGEDTLFYYVEKEGIIISAASAEMNLAESNAEMTNCATLPAYRKFGLMKYLLQELEKDAKKHHVYCLYTIARALSFGMNRVFHQLGYTYTGRLANNCYIFDKIEDMNVWVKQGE